MLIVISPAKTLDLESPIKIASHSQPELLKKSSELIKTLRTQSADDLKKLMGISESLAELNVERFQTWKAPFNPSNARPSALTFKGDVYLGLEAEKFTEKQFEYAQNHLRILSGLYGVLRPLDLMQAYRLEMGTKLQINDHANLYQFWGSQITAALNRQLAQTNSKTLVNLASNEYFKAIKNKELDAQIITPVFKDWSKDQYKVIGFLAKKARGRMASWIIKSKAKSLQKLSRFDLDGYQFSAELSTEAQPVYLRKA